MVSPSVEVHQAPELIGTVGTFHWGTPDSGRRWPRLHEAWGTLEFHPREIREFGDRAGIVVVAHVRNVGLGSGVVTDRQVAHIFWVGKGSVARIDVYWEPARALEAVGLRQ